MHKTAHKNGIFRGIFLALIALCMAGGPNTKLYSTNFLWGAAFSAHQTEGSSGGSEQGDWYEFEHRSPSPIQNGDTADIAVNFWDRYQEDIQIAHDMGLNTLRTSIAWEKIEPVEGQFNQEVLNHYREIFKTMIAQGIRPMIALHHFTHPQWFHKKGGWLNSESPQWFLSYAQFVVSGLKDLCDLWLPFNEPMMMVQMGYLKGEMPPQKSTLNEAFEAAYNLARTHRLVSAYIHQVQPPTNSDSLRGVSVAYAFSYFEPVNPDSDMDKKAVDAMMTLSNWDWLESLYTGTLEFHIPKEVYDKPLVRAFPKTDLTDDTPMDFVGINYYGRYLLKYEPTSSLKISWVIPSGPLADNGWSPYPKGLGELLKMVHSRWKDLPILVTENGLADRDDKMRPQFIRDHLAQLDDAKTQGIDVRGYYHWSLMDNFEWASGYQYKFGLVEVDFKNQLKRNPRNSAKIYTEEISHRK